MSCFYKINKIKNKILIKIKINLYQYLVFKKAFTFWSKLVSDNFSKLLRKNNVLFNLVNNYLELIELCLEIIIFAECLSCILHIYTVSDVNIKKT